MEPTEDQKTEKYVKQCLDGTLYMKHRFTIWIGNIVFFMRKQQY